MIHAVIPFIVAPHWMGQQSALRPASAQAGAADGLWNFMLALAAGVYAVVMAFTVYAVVRRRDAETRDPPPVATGAEQRRERTMRRAVGSAIALTIVILLVVLVRDYSVGRANTVPTSDPTALHVRLIGHQWWWEVQYQDSSPQRQLTAANEVHVPVGRPVIFTLESADVIHSFWIPALDGKKDMIPGHRNSAWFRADTPGVYRGQCAEFCGYQHAKMAIVVVAQPAGEFRRWYDAQLQPARAPADSLRRAGERVFLAGPCALCHTVAGTSAGGKVGPDLTHVGSRLAIAAGTLPNSRANLMAWIADPQRIKPGVVMPRVPLTGQQLQAVAAYLEGLR